MKSSGRIPVKSIVSGSIAEEAGIESGDFLLQINGQKIGDIFDYRFLITDEELVVEVEKPDGEVWEIDIDKEQYEDLGIDFEDGLIDEAKSCTNNCIFCFIDQLPKGMRETLYFKDDDSRLSFLSGNYVTLTNMKQSDIDRIIRYRMSPINVSVHTTNPELRKKMLGNRFAGDIMGKIKSLVDGGIEVNCQIVLCRNINDKDELDKTILDLGAMYPGVGSISIVPVGLTGWRQGLCELSPYDVEGSAEVVERVERLQKRFLADYDTRLAYLADEFYIMAGKTLPEFDEYEDFPQIENGVGLVSMLRHEYYEYLEELVSRQVDFNSIESGRSISIATGVSVSKFIEEMAKELEKRYNGLKIAVYTIKNCFFGENVTVTGLLTGTDIIKQLKGKELGAELLLSRNMFRSGEEVLLDDCTVEELEKELSVKVTIVENNGKDFVDRILNL